MTLRVLPSQDRSKTRVEAILEASQAHLLDVGFGKFSMSAVALEVGCSVPTIYRYFSNRAALLNAVVPEMEELEKISREVLRIKRSNLSDAEKLIALQEVLEAI